MGKDLSLTVRILGEIKDLSSKLAAGGKRLKEFGAKASKMANTMAKGMAIAAGAVAGVTAAIFAFTSSVAKSGDELQKMNIRTGMSVETLSAMKYHLELNDATLGDLERAYRGFTEFQTRVVDGGKDQIAVSKRLGVSMRDEKGRMKDRETLMMEYMQALANVTDETEQLRLTQEVFGRRTALTLIPAIKQMKGGIEDAKRAAEEAGELWTQQDADAAAGFLDMTVELRKAVFGTLKVLARPLFKPFTTGMKAARQFVVTEIMPFAKRAGERMRDWFEANIGNILAFVRGLVAGFRGAFDGIIRGAAAFLGYVRNLVMRFLPGIFGEAEEGLTLAERMEKAGQRVGAVIARIMQIIIGLKIAGLIMSVVGGLMTLIAVLTGLGPVVLIVIAGIIAWLVARRGDLLGIVKSIIDRVSKAVAWVREHFGEELAFITKLLTGNKEAWVAVIDEVLAVLGVSWNEFERWVKDIGDGFVTLTELLTLNKDAWYEVGLGIASMIGVSKPQFDNWLADIKGGFGTLKDLLAGNKDAWYETGLGIASFLGVSKDRFDKWIGDIRKAFTDLIGFFTGAWDIIKGIFTGEAWDTLGQKIDDFNENANRAAAEVLVGLGIGKSYIKEVMDYEAAAGAGAAMTDPDWWPGKTMGISRPAADGGAGGDIDVDVNVTGILDEKFLERELIPAIRRAIELGIVRRG